MEPCASNVIEFFAYSILMVAKASKFSLVGEVHSVLHLY